MPLGPLRIYEYTETDSEATFSELLNLLGDSIGDVIGMLRGTPTQRAAITPPERLRWQDTDAAARTWVGVSGNWELESTLWTLEMTAVGTEPRARHRVRDGMVELAGVGAKTAGTYFAMTLPAGRRPSRTLTFPDAAASGQSIQILTNGQVNYSNVNAAQVTFAGISFLPAS